MNKPIASILCSNPSLFGKLCSLSNKILLHYNLLLPTDTFPNRREHFSHFVNIKPESFNDINDQQKVLCLALLVPCIFATMTDQVFPIVVKPKEFLECIVPLESQDLSYNVQRINKFLKEKDSILHRLLEETDIFQKLQEWTSLTWGDILYITNHLPKEKSWNELTEEEKTIVRLQKNLYWYKNPSQTNFSVGSFLCSFPSTASGHAYILQRKTELSAYQPWTGPYDEEHISLSLWKKDDKIFTHEAILQQFTFDSEHFDSVKIFIEHELKSSESVEEEILRKCYAGQYPKTFSIVPDKNSFPLYKKTFKDLCLEATEDEVLAVVFQLVWTLATLQTLFPGFQHHDFVNNIALVNYPKPRCYRISRSSFSFHIPAELPLPIIQSFDSCTCLSKDFQIPQSLHFDPKKEVLEIVNLVGNEELKQVCQENTIQNILIHEIFDRFFTKQSLKSFSIAMMEHL